MKSQDIEITEEDVIDQAKKTAAQQLAMYGMANLPDESLTSYAVNLLQKEGEYRRVLQRLTEEKILDYVRATVTIVDQEVTGEEFNKLFEVEAE